MPNTAQLLAKHFDLALEAPDGIQKLRELILTLAMQGKLVPQYPNDQPASELLKEIEAEKTGTRPGVRSTLAASSSPNTTIPLPELPSSWIRSDLSRLARILNGRAYKQSEMLSEGTPILRVGNLFTSDKWYYSDLLLEEDKYINSGDLIYSWSASFGPFIWNGPSVIFHYHIWKVDIISRTNVLRDYLKHYLDSVTKAIKKSGHGISMVHMTKERMEKLQVPLPPLAEQHRIVAKIDQLMAICDELERKRDGLQERRLAVHTAALRRLLEATEASDFFEAWGFLIEHFGELYSVKENVAELRKAILQLAVMGKLVKQDPNDPPASKLLKEIEAEKRRLVKEGKIKAPKPLPAIKADEVPFAVPTGWVWASISELSFKVSDGEHATPVRGTTGYYLLSARNVTNSGIQLTDVDYVPESEFERIRKRCDPEIGDILISCSGSVGRIAIADRNDYVMVRSAAFVKHDQSRVQSSYLANCLRSPTAQAQISAKSRTTAQSNLFIGKILELLIPLPPLSEQRRIVAKVDQLMALCDSLERHIEASTTKKSDILNAVMAKV